jgi:endonuclease YncB( thermonuclease family)
MRSWVLQDVDILQPDRSTLPTSLFAAIMESARRFLWAMALVLSLLAFDSHRASADDLKGRATVIDGDTLEVHGVRIRLWGIDAPESSQLCRNDESIQYRCGVFAANNNLDQLLSDQTVTCIPVGLDRYRRTVAICTVAELDIAEWLVSSGLALDWPRFSGRRYERFQVEAKRAHRGLWAGSFVAPWSFRACLRIGDRLGECSDGPVLLP